MILVEEREGGLDDENHGADHLGDGLYLTEHARGDYDTRLTRYYEAEAGNAKLTKEYDEYYPDEDESESGISEKKLPDEDSYHRGDDHKLIREGIYELAEIGDEIIFSRYFSVEHIGKACNYIDDSGNYASPYRDILHNQASLQSEQM